jgi:predicted nucleotidyltransferase component of viral defense system
MTNAPHAAAITQRLLKIKDRLEVRYENLLTTFLIERLVARLVADERLRHSLVFKGGFVSMKIYDSPRYTVDLDALLIKSNIEETLKRTRAAAESDIKDGVWFHYEDQIDLQTQGEYGGFRQIYRAGVGPKLKNLKKAQIVNFDLGIGDPVVPGPINAETASLISGEELSWSVYPIETMIAEKLHAIVALGPANSRSKDIFDLGIFLPKAKSKTLAIALKKCFAHRKTEMPEKISDAINALDTTALRRGWRSAVASVSQPPEFSEALAMVITELKRFENS